MPEIVPFGEYRPDVSDLLGNHTRAIDNVVPRADGYGPVASIVSYTDALPGPCKGAFRALDSSGSVVIFAATATSLYLLDNTTLEWTNVSKTSGTYTYSLPGEQIWQFAQYDDFVIAVQGGEPPQVYEINVSTYFADLGGTPPTAKFVNVVNEFVVLSGLVSFPKRIQWSGRASPATWTSGTLESDFQDFGDGGTVGAIGGGEGQTLVMQTTAMRRMIYQPGSPVIFSFERISEDVGIAAPYSMVRYGRRVFFFSNSGFQMSVDGNVPTSIGKEIVDNTFVSEWDVDHPELMFSITDPTGTRVVFVYKTLASEDTDRFDRVLIYDWALERWSTADGLVSRFAAALSQTGLTLENLDDIVYVNETGDTTSASAVVTNVSDTSNLYVGMTVTGTGIPASTTILTVDGASQITLDQNATATNTGVALAFAGSLDSITVSSLDAFPVAFGKQMAFFDLDDKLGFLGGPNLEATLETSEKGEASTQMMVSGFYPVSDATNIFGQVSHRQRPSDTRMYLPEIAQDDAGLVAQRVDTRYSRSRIRIPAGEDWTFAAGVAPEYKPTGNR